MFKPTSQLFSGLANKTRNTLNSSQKASQRKRMRQVDATIYNIREGLKMVNHQNPSVEAQEANWKKSMEEFNFMKYFNPQYFKPEQTCTPRMKYFFVSKKEKPGFKSMNWARFKTKTSINRETPYAMLPNTTPITNNRKHGNQD